MADDGRLRYVTKVGITAQQHSFTVDQAYLHMRRHARNNNASMRVVAEAIVAVGLKHGASPGLLLGSVGQAVLHHVHSPMMVVPRSWAADEGQRGLV